MLSIQARFFSVFRIWIWYAFSVAAVCWLSWFLYMQALFWFCIFFMLSKCHFACRFLHALLFYTFFFDFLFPDFLLLTTTTLYRQPDDFFFFKKNRRNHFRFAQYGLLRGTTQNEWLNLFLCLKGFSGIPSSIILPTEGIIGIALKMYVVESKGGAIACMLLALFFLGTWPAVMTLLERRGRLPQHTYLDYSITNLLAAVIIAFTFGEIGKSTHEAPNFLTQLSQLSVRWAI